jgi:hypothetical protein
MPTKMAETSSAMAKKPELDETTLCVMGALVHMPPKPRDQMKLGKPRGKPKKSLAKQRPPSPQKE